MKQFYILGGIRKIGGNNLRKIGWNKNSNFVPRAEQGSFQTEGF
jgi:hypothetical protein